MTFATLSLTLAASLLAAPCLADEAGDWLDLTQRLAAQESPSPAAALQAESAVRRAMRAARLQAPGGARDAQLAQVEAARDVLARLFPEERRFLDAELAQARRRLGALHVLAAAAAGPAGRAAADQALSVSWPRRLRDRGEAPPRLPLRLAEPARRDAPLMQAPPRQEEPPRWSNPRAVSL